MNRSSGEIVVLFVSAANHRSVNLTMGVILRTNPTNGKTHRNNLSADLPKCFENYARKLILIKNLDFHDLSVEF